MAATIIAVLTVIAPEPTDVPRALATSFAPIPHVIKTPKIIASTRSVGPNWEMTSMKLLR
jgi:hypothetical protein